jgi:hypothetical protein
MTEKTRDSEILALFDELTLEDQAKVAICLTEHTRESVLALSPMARVKLTRLVLNGVITHPSLRMHLGIH